ncbi:hypothetical protein LOC71_19215 [Rhodopirellula sp. JC740]|uniref:Uncharacterized protein n=2 Tax=Rhodopirellula halodulae TaxID=2894198 RepID=A0ABS8NLF6_9BACT|nr:hypothetical protein [Rhodopirellula sp. JC740]
MCFSSREGNDLMVAQFHLLPPDTMRHPSKIAYQCCCAISRDAPLVDRLWQCQRLFDQLQPENTPADLIPLVSRYQSRLRRYCELTVPEREALAKDILISFWGEICGGDPLKG